MELKKQMTDNSQASILRQIVAGPRARHPEAGLDLCYMTDFSMSSIVWFAGLLLNFISRCHLWPEFSMAEESLSEPY